jgi:predicted helicase
MESLFGYLYIRINELCDIYNACKFGKIRNGNCPIKRFQSYITYEIKQGEVILLVKTTENVDLLESDLKNYFISSGCHIYFENGGTEYFSKDIIHQIIPKLQEMNITFHICSKEEINEIKQKVYLKKDDSTIPVPKDYQLETLHKLSNYYDKYNTGKIYWSCGLGKTMLSLFFVKNKLLKKVVIGVPSMSLQKQFKDEILKLFPNEKNILCIGSIQTTDIEKISYFLENESLECKFLITTYHSCNLLLSLPEVDLKIGDESHHLVGKSCSSDRNFLLFHQICSSKTLFMTATEKIIEEKEEPSIYSMDNEEIFGKVIDSKSVKWAIENKKITDFQVIVIKNKEEDFNIIIEKFRLSGELLEKLNVHLLISAYMTLKSLETIDKISHILIYTNTIDNAKLVNKYIDLLFENELISIPKNDLYYSALYSNCGKDIKTELDIFRKSRFGIISCVYLFGEGFDEPKLNGVCFADKMESDIRITQYALRPNRLEKLNNSKIAFVIIPYIDFEKLTIIISKLRKMNDTIQSKIRLFEIIFDGTKNPRTQNPLPEPMNENMDELEKLKIKLRHSKALSSYLSKIEDEYEYMRIVNNELNIQSKEEYIQRKEEHESYIENPVIHFNGIWKNWIDFLGIDTSLFIQTKTEWKKFCKHNQIKTIQEYKDACEIYPKLPKNPNEFYTGFTNLFFELRN